MSVHFWRIRKDGGLARADRETILDTPRAVPAVPTKTYTLLGVARGRLEETGFDNVQLRHADADGEKLDTSGLVRDVMALVKGGTEAPKLSPSARAALAISLIEFSVLAMKCGLI